MLAPLTWSDLDWPDENGAESQGCDDGHAPRHCHHNIVVKPHAGRAAHPGADGHTNSTVSVEAEDP